MKFAPSASKSMVALLAVAVLLAGCSGGSSPASPTTADTTEELGPTETVTTDPPEDTTTASQPGVNAGTDAVPSEFTRLQPGETTQINYRGQTITLSYTQAEGESQITLSLNNTQESIRQDMAATAEAVSQSVDNLQFVVKPVKEEVRDEQTVYVLDDTWDGQYVEIEVYCKSGC